MALEPDLIDHGLTWGPFLVRCSFDITWYLVLWPVITVCAACSLNRYCTRATVSPYRHFGVGWGVVLNCCGKIWGNLGNSSAYNKPRLAGARDGFGAALHLQFVEDPAVMPFDRVQGQEKPRADLTIRESFGQELKYFQLALAQWLDQGLGRGRGSAAVSALFCSSAAKTASNLTD